ncbi:hypothetical protein GCM10025876_33550 [Demequina litorisediminis]|uniref:MBG domain-containing protein n=1 Tax=Demequina litorisediminis TaxID=1849022 RepID=A0ABQ6IHG0_9MICO|nr:hypothetical protein GCM10025876_33550 [Demequina litorisediminis]
MDALEPTDGVLWPVDSGEPSSTSATYTIETVGLAETNLPVPAAPRTVEAEGAWSYDPSVDEVVGDDESTLGLTYTVTADTGYLTAERLAASPRRPAARPMPPWAPSTWRFRLRWTRLALPISRRA